MEDRVGGLHRQRLPATLHPVVLICVHSALPGSAADGGAAAESQPADFALSPCPLVSAVSAVQHTSTAGEAGRP